MKVKVCFFEKDESLLNKFKPLINPETTEIFRFEKLSELLEFGMMYPCSVFIINYDATPNADSFSQIVREKQFATYIYYYSSEMTLKSMQKCFSIGIDDCFTNETKSMVIKKKLEMAISRIQSAANDLSVANKLHLIPEGNVLIRKGVTLVLSKRQFQIFSVLHESFPDYVSREDILKKIKLQHIGIRTIDVHIFFMKDQLKRIGIGVISKREHGYGIEYNDVADIKSRKLLA